jgi:hypothetical integral membrane protein (TIGR02206 family)
MGSSENGWSLLTPTPLLPRGQGFDYFGPVHLAWIAYCVVLIACCTHLYLRASEKGRRRATWGLAIVPLVLLVSQDALMIASGTFTPAWWPLHSCNACEYLGLIYAAIPAAWIGEMLFCLSTTGAVCAILFPGWAWCPPLSWPVFCGFTEHSLMLALVVAKVLSGELKPDLRRMWQAVAFSGAYALFCMFVNSRLGTNFMFLNAPADGSPLIAFEQWLGYPGYLAPFLLGILALWRGMYALARRVHVTPCHTPQDQVCLDDGSFAGQQAEGSYSRHSRG